MDRRGFICSIAAAGTGLSLPRHEARETTAAHYEVRGFTCITCAVGLETILKQEPGVVRVSAAYPAGTCDVGFDASLTSDEKIRSVIASLGFTVA